MKVISFKVEDEIYNKLRSTNKTFKELFNPLLNQAINQKYTNSIHSCSNCRYKDAWLSFLRIWKGG